LCYIVTISVWSLAHPTSSNRFSCSAYLLFFSFNATPTTEIYTLSLHDALPISHRLPEGQQSQGRLGGHRGGPERGARQRAGHDRSEEHTSELQSHLNLVCRLLLEKKNTIIKENAIYTN